MTSKANATALEPWTSEFEIDVRRRLASIESHQLRTDELLMSMQMDARKRAREQAERENSINEKLTRLVGLLTSSIGNGAHHESADEKDG